MSFKQSKKGASGKSKLTEEITSHVTRDRAHFNRLPRSPNEREPSMAPQTFKVNDLMQEIQNMEPQNVASTDSGPAESRIQLDQSNAYESIQPAQDPSQHMVPMYNSIMVPLPHVLNYAYPSSSTCDRNRIPDLKMYNVNEEYPVYNLQSENDCEEPVKAAEESEEKKENDPESNKESKFIYFNGLCTEDVHQADTQNVEWSNSESFVRYLTNYIKTFQRRDFDLNAETEYKFTEKNPYDKTVDESHSRGLWYIENRNPLHAILYFEAAVRVNENDSEAWKHLIDILIYNEQYYDAFCLAKKSLHHNLNYFSMIIYNFLFDEQYHYQGCQAILNWLKSHPDYRDIVPPNYMMEDKTSTLVEEEQVADLKTMLTKITLRKAYKPDYYVHIALSKLHEISRDYKKSNECIFKALRTRTDNLCQNWINILYNLIRDNDTTQALALIENITKKKTLCSLRINCQNINGIINMYLGNYKKACRCLLATLDRLIVWQTMEACDLQKDTLWAELRLCIELMQRKDLLGLVEEINFKKLCEEFDYKPIV